MVELLLLPLVREIAKQCILVAMFSAMCIGGPFIDSALSPGVVRDFFAGELLRNGKGVIAPGGRVAVLPARDGNVYCLDLEKKEVRWVYSTGVWVFDVHIVDGSVLLVLDAKDRVARILSLELSTGRRNWLHVPKRTSRDWKVSRGGSLGYVTRGGFALLDLRSGTIVHEQEVYRDTHIAGLDDRGRFVLAGEQKVCFFDAKRKRTVAEHSIEKLQGCRDIQYSGNVLFCQKDDEVVAIEFSSGDVLWRNQLESRFNRVQIAGTRLLVVGDKQVDVLCRRSGESVLSFKKMFERAVRYDASSESLVYTDPAGSIVLLALESGNVRKKIDTESWQNLLAAGNGLVLVHDLDGLVYSLASSTWERADVGSIGLGRIAAYAVCKDVFVASGTSGVAAAFSVESGDMLWQNRAWNVRVVASTEDGIVILGGSDGAFLIDPRTGDVLAKAEGKVLFCEQGGCLITDEERGLLAFHGSKNGRFFVRWKSMAEGLGAGDAICCGKNYFLWGEGGLVVLGKGDGGKRWFKEGDHSRARLHCSSSLVLVERDDKASAYDTSGGMLRWSLSGLSSKRVLSMDNELVLVKESPAIVSAFSSKKGQFTWRAELDEKGEGKEVLAAIKLGNRVAVASLKGGIEVLDAASGKQLAGYPISCSELNRSVRLTIDGSLLTAVCDLGNVRVFDLAVDPNQ